MRAASSPNEAEAPQRRDAQGLPTHQSSSSPVEAPRELGSHALLSNIRGQRHVHVLIDERAQV
eukprot:4903601-Alexandrium_andersonii.AAC.1